MINFSVIKQIIFGIAGVIVLKLGYVMFKKCQKPMPISDKNLKIFVYGTYENDWRNHVRKECDICNCFCHVYIRIMGAINSTQVSFDLYIQVLTSMDISEAIIGLHKRGVLVRIITNYTTSDSEESTIKFLQNNGVEVRAKQYFTLSCYNFCLIDINQPGALLMTGELNFAKDNMPGNFENTMFAMDPICMDIFQRQFNTLWNFLA